MVPMLLSQGKSTVAESNSPATRAVHKRAGPHFPRSGRHGGGLVPVAAALFRADHNPPAIPACLNLSSATGMIAAGPAVIVRRKRVNIRPRSDALLPVDAGSRSILGAYFMLNIPTDLLRTLVAV